MARSVSSQTPARPCQHLGRSRGVSARAVLERDGDLHEPLEEVALGPFDGEPERLERFVRGEELPRVEQRDEGGEAGIATERGAAFGGGRRAGHGFRARPAPDARAPARKPLSIGSILSWYDLMAECILSPG